MRRLGIPRILAQVMLWLAMCCASFVSAQAPAPTGPRFEIRRYVIEGATLVSAAELDALTSPFAGKDKNFADVQRALEALEKVFSSRGFSAVQILLPEQELEKGEVKFKVIEAKIGKVIVEGNKNFDEDNIRRSLPGMQSGIAPNTLKLADALRIANESPSKQTTVLLRGGSEEGLVDAVVRVVDETPLKYSVSLDNTGTPQTGKFRVGIGFQHSNLWNRDHTLSGQYVTAPNDPINTEKFTLTPSRNVFVIGLSYHIPLYTLGDSIDFSVGQSNVNSGLVANSLHIAGAGTIAGAKYNFNLPRWGDVEHKLVFGADWRAYQSRVTQFVGGPQLVPDVTVRPVSLTYSGTHRSAASETSFYFSTYDNLPGDRHKVAGQDFFTASRAGSSANYSLQRFGISHNRSFANDFQFRAAFSGQMTKDLLVSGEQFGVGGADSVRGFAEREIASDVGTRGSTELYSPDFATSLAFGANTRIRALTFYDWGRVTRNKASILEVQSQTIASVGFGFRVAVGTNVFMRLDWGRIVDPGGVQARGNGLGHLNISYLFF